jgi:hypothetical protein
VTCGREIRGRDGKGLGYFCNQTPLHLGKCVQTMTTADVVPSSETEEPHVQGQVPPEEAP